MQAQRARRTGQVHHWRHSETESQAGAGGRRGGGIGEEVQRPTYRTVNAYCLENTDDWCVGSTLSLSRHRCARWWLSLNYHSVWSEEQGGRQGGGKRWEKSISRAQCKSFKESSNQTARIKDRSTVLRVCLTTTIWLRHKHCKLFGGPNLSTFTYWPLRDHFFKSTVLTVQRNTAHYKL